MGRLIDADALMDNMFLYAAPEMMWDRIDIMHKINEMPTVEQRKTGKWISLCEGMGLEIVKCDQCGYIKNRRAEFCEKCGCEMEGEW